MEFINKTFLKKESYSDVESSQNSKLIEGDSFSNMNLDINNYETGNETICCVELINNNKIYIKFKENWTVKDVK